jgi:hypothetical protein
MARRKNPLDKLVDAATGALKDPVGAAGKAVEQAKGTAAVGRMVAGQVGRAALGKATEAAGVVTSRVPGRPPSNAQRTTSTSPKPGTEEKPAPAEKAPAGTATKAARKSPAKKAPAKKTAKKAPVKKAAKKAPAKKAAKKAPAKKAAKKSTPPKTPAPLTAQQVAEVEDGPDTTTPVGTTAADVATNPDTIETDLQQPGTEPLLDPGTASAIRSESETLRKAAESSAESSPESSAGDAPGEQPSS